MIRRGLSLLIMFIVVVVSFLETMLWLLKAEISVSREIMTLGIFIISLLGLFILTGGRKKKDHERNIFIKEDKDSILISEGAIKQLVENSLLKINSVRDNKIFIKYTKENKISLKLELILAPDSNIMNVTNLVEKNIHEAFDRILGEKVENIQITIKGFNEPAKKA